MRACPGLRTSAVGSRYQGAVQAKADRTTMILTTSRLVDCTPSSPLLHTAPVGRRRGQEKVCTVVDRGKDKKRWSMTDSVQKRAKKVKGSGEVR